MNPAITSPTHTGTLKPEGTPPRFYWIVPELVSTYGPFRYVDTGQLVPKVWDVEQENATCSSSTTPTSTRGVGANQTNPTPAGSDPLRWGCRVVKMPACNFDVQTPCGKFWYHPGNGEWAEYSELTAKFGAFIAEAQAIAALTHPDTPPPPGWKPPESACPECGVKDGHQSLCSRKATDAKPAGPGLRAAGEVVRYIRNEMYANTTTPGRKDGVEQIITAERVAVLEEMRRRFFSKGLGYAGEVINSFIEELRGQQ